MATPRSGKTGFTPRKGHSLEHRFGEKCWATDNGCIEWMGSRTKHGYGHTSVDGVHQYAHRVALYIQGVGIPDGTEIDHICRNKSCVNPDHLEAVTHAENMARGGGIGSANASKTHCPRGHEYTHENTRYEKHKGRNPYRRCRTCERAKR